MVIISELEGDWGPLTVLKFCKCLTKRRFSFSPQNFRASFGNFLLVFWQLEAKEILEAMEEI